MWRHVVYGIYSGVGPFYTKQGNILQSSNAFANNLIEKFYCAISENDLLK